MTWTIYYIALIGDWNAKVGEGTTGLENIGNFGLGKRNENRERLIDFCLKKII